MHQHAAGSFVRSYVLFCFATLGAPRNRFVVVGGGVAAATCFRFCLLEPFFLNPVVPCVINPRAQEPDDFCGAFDEFQAMNGGKE